MGLSIRPTTRKNARNISPVSVPSRGNGVIDHARHQRRFRADDYQVSVPSRGNGVIDSTLARLMASFVQVSVPSRGNGVIDTAINAYNSQLFEFPSPLGEMGLSIHAAGQDEQQPRIVSVPSRGNRVIDKTLPKPSLFLC